MLVLLRLYKKALVLPSSVKIQFVFQIQCLFFSFKRQLFLGEFISPGRPSDLINIGAESGKYD